MFKKHVTRLASSVGQKKNEGRGGIEPQTFRTPTHFQLQAGTQILFLFSTPYPKQINILEYSIAVLEVFE